MNSTFVIDGLIGTAWAAVNACLLFAIVKVHRKHFPRITGAGLTLDVVTLYVASVVGVLTCLGVFGAFSRFGMLAAMACASASMLLIGCQGGTASQQMSAVGAISPASRRFGPALAIWLLSFCLLLGHVVADGLLRLPKDYDCLMYHLPLIDHWLQAGSLYAPDSANWFTSANSELVGAWMTGVFSGDFLAPLNNVPFLIMWAAAAIELSRRVGMMGVWPHLSAAATLAVHTTIHESDDVSNDLMVVACCLSAAVYTLRYSSARIPIHLGMLGIAVGLLAGVKYYAVGYAVVIVAVLIVAALLKREFSTAVKSGAIACVLAIPFGGYWYIRNVVLTGTPLFPLGSAVETPGVGYPDIWSTTLAGNGSPQVPDLAMLAVWRMCGPVHLAAVVMTLGIVVALIVVSFLRRASHRRSERCFPKQLLALWILGSLLILLATPFSVEDQPGTLNHLRWAYTPIRYGLCYLSFLTIGCFALVASVARWLGPSYGRTVLALCTALVAWQWTQRLVFPSDIDLAVAALIGISVFLLSCFLRMSIWRSSRRVQIAGTLGLALLAGVGTSLLSSRWHQGLASHFDEVFVTDLFTYIEGEWQEGAVVHVYATRPYSFFGAQRQNRVVHPRFSSRGNELLFAPAAGEIVVVERTDENPVSRYRGTYELLSGSAMYDPIESSANGVYAAFRRNAAAREGVRE